MFKYLPEVKKVINELNKQTDELEMLVKRVDELVCDDIIKDFTLSNAHKTVLDNCYIYDVKEDDFNHIKNYLKQIQDVILPDMLIMAQTNQVDSFRIMFKKG